MVFAALCTAPQAWAAEPKISGCTTVLPDTSVKVELSRTETKSVQDSTVRYGLFHIANVGKAPITMEAFKGKSGAVEDLPYAREVVEQTGEWGPADIRFADIMQPGKLVLAPGASLDYETEIEPQLPTWDPAAQFHLVLPLSDYHTCAVSAGYTLQPKNTQARTTQDDRGKLASRKLGADVCPAKTFDQDVTLTYIKSQEYDFGPYAEPGHKEVLDTLEIANYRFTPITLHGEKHGDDFYVPESLLLVQAPSQKDEDDWVTTSQPQPAEVRYPVDTLSVPAGGRAQFLALVDRGVDRDLVFTPRAVLADPEGPVCTVSKPLPPHRGDCGCSGKH